MYRVKHAVILTGIHGERRIEDFGAPSITLTQSGESW